MTQFLIFLGHFTLDNDIEHVYTDRRDSGWSRVTPGRKAMRCSLVGKGLEYSAGVTGGDHQKLTSVFCCNKWLTKTMRRFRIIAAH